MEPVDLCERVSGNSPASSTAARYVSRDVAMPLEPVVISERVVKTMRVAIPAYFSISVSSKPFRCSRR